MSGKFGLYPDLLYFVIKLWDFQRLMDNVDIFVLIGN